MSTKLVIHRFGKDTNFQSLHMIIEKNNNGSYHTRFGEWVDGKMEVKKKDMKKSRMVVNVVSEEDANTLSFDVCANKFNKMDTFIEINDKSDGKVENYPLFEKKLTDKEIDIASNEEWANRHFYNKPDINYTSQNSNITFNSYNTISYSSPLEHSLEKVRENNARIMENIHMLNRTLNYTKKKEILDMINPKPLHSYPCNECGKCFVYETGLRRHFFIRHGNSDTQPRWQTVWTCAECLQVWPRQDAAITHSNQCCQENNADCIREIKTSLLLQCEFCEKVFTSIPGLVRHSKLHTVKKNYECSVCNVIFLSYKTAEKHWLLCPWLKLSYNFLLPKMLLCNACDRKFRNYDQLYNHRYKVSHYLSKIHENASEPVYQCEICSQWFKEITTLENHRQQYHPYFNSGLIYNVKNHHGSTNTLQES